MINTNITTICADRPCKASYAHDRTRRFPGGRGRSPGFVGIQGRKDVPYLGVRRSDDGGATWGEERVVADWRMFYSPQVCLPQLACGPAGGQQPDRLYATWGEEGRGGLRVMLSYSADRGATWSTPACLSEQPEPGPGVRPQDALIPSVAVNKHGVVAVSWYDRRGLPAQRGNTLDRKGWNVRMRASGDGGATWGPSVQVNDVTSEAPALSALGHTAGLAADAGGVFHAAWIDHRTSVLQVWTAAVRARSAP